MQLTQSQLQELKVHFTYWRAIQQCEGRSYPSKADFQLLAERAVKYGALDGVNSAWSRAAKELSDEGQIRLHVPRPAPPPIPSDFADQIRQMPSSELLKKLNTDRAFSDLYGRWAAGERPEGYAAEQAEYSLTAAEYNSLPAATALRKYKSDPAFARAVDKLFATGAVRTTNIVGTPQ